MASRVCRIGRRRPRVARSPRTTSAAASARASTTAATTSTSSHPRQRIQEQEQVGVRPGHLDNDVPTGASVPSWSSISAVPSRTSRTSVFAAGGAIGIPTATACSAATAAPTAASVAAFGACGFKLDSGMLLQTQHILCAQPSHRSCPVHHDDQLLILSSQRLQEPLLVASTRGV
eukprot:scaffold2252_cov255-Pinguiococcus_pyrenoidosus.AAC.2